MTYPAKQEIPKNELGMVDIKLYIYNLLKSYYNLIKEIGPENIFFIHSESYKNIKEKKSTILITYIGGETSSLGIREEGYQIDVWAFSMEKSDKIAHIIIDLLNRRTLDGIKIKLNAHRAEGTPAKNGVYRNSMDFDFVFKDMKY